MTTYKSFQEVVYNEIFVVKYSPGYYAVVKDVFYTDLVPFDKIVWPIGQIVTEHAIERVKRTFGYKVTVLDV